MNVSSIAVTGAAGLVGQPLLQVLADHPDVTRVVGLDVREPERASATRRIPPRRHRGHRAGAAARGHRRDRAPRRRRRPDSRRSADGPGERRRHPPGARRRGRGRRAAGRASVERDRVRRVGEQPRPAHRGRRRAPQPEVLARGAGRRGRAAARRVAPRRTPTSSPPRCAPRPSSARVPSAFPPGCCSAARRCGCGARRHRCRSCTSTTSSPALALAATTDLPGVYNVAADGWLDADDARALIPRPPVPALPDEALERCAAPHVGARRRRRAAGHRAVPGAPVGDRQRPPARRGLGAAAHERAGDPPRGSRRCRRAIRRRSSSPVGRSCSSTGAAVAVRRRRSDATPRGSAFSAPRAPSWRYPG